MDSPFTAFGEFYPVLLTISLAISFLGGKSFLQLFELGSHYPLPNTVVMHQY